MRSVAQATSTRDTSAPGRDRHAPQTRLSIDPGHAEKGLVTLVLAVVELLRQLLLKQTLRRLESGNLTPDQTERLGIAMMRLEQTMDELKRHFDLSDDDLNLDLGPLGTLF